MHHPKIGIFDSGVGGLSVLRTIQQKLPKLSISYICDNQNFPYGPKDEEGVLRCVTEMVERFTSLHSTDLIVIACNTASTVALPTLRNQMDTPIVGVVPAIKPAAALSKTRTIGLLATPGTIKRAYTQNLVEEYAVDCTVLQVGSTLLVELAEKKLRGEAISKELIQKELKPFFEFEPTNPQKRMDTLVLGCTHFPLLVEELKALCPWPIDFVDSSAAIAERVASLLQNSAPAQPPSYAAYFSDLNADALKLKPVLASFGISQLAPL